MPLLSTLRLAAERFTESIPAVADATIAADVDRSHPTHVDVHARVLFEAPHRARYDETAAAALE